VNQATIILVAGKGEAALPLPIGMLWWVHEERHTIVFLSERGQTPEGSADNQFVNLWMVLTPFPKSSQGFHWSKLL